MQLAELLAGAAFLAFEATVSAVEEGHGVAARVFLGRVGVGLGFDSFGEVLVEDAEGAVLERSSHGVVQVGVGIFG